MALLATLQIDMQVGSGANATTQKAWFLGATKLYEDKDMATATGVTDVTTTLQGEVPLYEVDQLLLHGVLRTIEVDLVDSSKKVIGQRQIRYAGTKSATIEADVVGKNYAAGKSKKFQGAKVAAVIERRKKSFV